MTDEVRFHPLATAEIVEAQLWYERRTAGLGDRFMVSLEAVIAQAVDWPSSGSARTDDHGEVLERRIPLRGFPYSVVYRSEDDGLDVLAVPYHGREPRYWADRAEDLNP